MTIIRRPSRRRVTTDGFGEEKFSKPAGKTKKSYKESRASSHRVRMQARDNYWLNKRGHAPLTEEEKHLAYIKKRHYLYKLGKKHGVHLK